MAGLARLKHVGIAAVAIAAACARIGEAAGSWASATIGHVNALVLRFEVRLCEALAVFAERDEG